jgi:HEAT repeat protein
MDAYLVDLIERMNAEDRLPETGKPFNSADTVSWKAYRESEGLTDAAFIRQLVDYIPGETRYAYRDAAYFVLGKILAKTADPMAVQFYVNRLKIETDNFMLGSMLDRLADIEKDSSIDISPILRCAEDRRWHVRHCAILALAKTNHETAREKVRALVQLEDHRQNRQDIIYANAVLGTIGDASDIALLKPLCKSRIRDLKGSAEFAIERLEKGL